MASAARSVARQAFAERDWTRALDELRAADVDRGLDAAGLEDLAMAARLTGDAATSDDAYERAHRAWLETGRPDRAARAAFWLGMALMHEAEAARAGGWFARAGSLLDEHDLDTVERGFLLVPQALRALFGGAPAEALPLIEQQHAYATRFGDPDLLAMSLLGRGQASVMLGRLADGLAALDEAMVLVTTGTVSPVLSGIVYCAVIDACLEVCDFARAEEWTTSLTAWCDAQHGLVPFRGQCLVDRAEILHVRGLWDDAGERLREAHALLEETGHPAIGRAWYVRGDQLRTAGELDAAEDAYRQATAHGHDPHPGLALSWLARGQAEKAFAASRRVVAERSEARDRVQVLAAHVDIALAAGDVAAAREAAGHLAELSASLDTAMLRAVSLTARGAVELADDPAAATPSLRHALAAWVELGAPLQAARARVLLGRACAALGDRDTAEFEWETARGALVELGARPALAELDALVASVDSGATGASPAGGLTGREIEVLQQVATGKTNRAIAETLVISEKTVARHLSNIFTKLAVSTRAEATAYAFTHDLV